MARTKKNIPENITSLSKLTKGKVKPKINEVNKISTMVQLIATLLGIGVAVAAYLIYNNWLETRVTFPLDVPKVVIKSRTDVPERFWGTYRPGVYFGVKTRSPQSPVFGLMWFRQEIINNQLPLRHQCLMGNFEERYNWLEHDGENYGVQSMYDNGISITNTFVKRSVKNYGSEWTARFAVESELKDKVPRVSLLFYSALDNDGFLQPNIYNQNIQSIIGNSQATGRFRLRFRTSSAKNNVNYLSTSIRNLDGIEEGVMRGFARIEKDKLAYIGLGGEVFHPNSNNRNPNLVVYQVTFIPPFELEVIYESEENDMDRSSALTGQLYLETLNNYSQQFHHKFEETFRIRESPSTTKQEIYFAKAALSNLIGGIGYFYGQSKVKSVYNKEPVKYFEAPLYTAVPSRSFFPRGFLWDEGFHNLLIARWNIEISKDIIAHWLDLLNIEGWIPREQILDAEARARVPEEFVVQQNFNANPPALFLPLKYILQKMTENNGGISQEDRGYLKRVFPRLKKWYQWFNSTQFGKLPGTYRWRGRNGENVEELNPITLTSGFDDYPRATNPTDDERHVDLRCWMAFAAGVISDIAIVIDEPADEFASTRAYLSDNKLLDELHWSPKLQAYTDYGLHSNKVKLQKPKPLSPGAPPPSQNPVRVYLEEPTLQFINYFGYVSLFPFLLHIVEPSSDKLGKILIDLENTNLLWTPYGLRSLAKSSFYYQKNNNPNNPPYWRGAIWINVNYLAIEALKYYADIDGPFQSKAKELYAKLKSNIVSNMYKDYTQTGYIWEQYNDENGHGLRSHPFTGWSALVTLIMSEV